MYKGFSGLVDSAFLFCLFITHRLNAAKNADKIILLRNSRIIQTGTHRRLISEDGEYKNMYEMQAKRYELDPDEKIII